MSQKLRKYLAYYQKVLSADPENIEARLRLAAIFRELGRTEHAVAEYVTASKLLAKEGLPLEAIAACKAVLELSPDHSEIQYFLARLFAQVPDAMSRSSRIAKPVNKMVLRQTPAPANPDVLEPIELSDPIEGPSSAWQHEKPTKTGWVEDTLASDPTTPFVDDDDDEGTVDLDPDDDDTSPLDSDLIPKFDDITREMEPLNPDELTPPQQPTPQLLVRSTRPVKPLTRPPDDPLKRGPTFETFEVNVFDMESLGLGDESSEIDVSFLDAFEGEVGEFAADEVSETYPAIFRVNRDDLPEIPLLSKLPAHVFMRLLGVIDVQRIPTGTTILQPDHSSRTLFIIVRGAARVTRLVAGEQVELAKMGEGEFFGEFMLLTGRTGSATVRATTDCELLAIHESVIHDIADEYPVLWDELWDFYYARMLNNLLASSDIFRPLDPDTRRELAQRFEMQEVVTDQIFLREGDACRDLYLVLSGEVTAERRTSGGVQKLATIREGEFFGVASSLNDDPYLADVRAERDTMLLTLPSEEFRQITESNAEVLKAVELAIMSRRAMNPTFTSGITEYAAHGVAKFD